MREIKFRAWDKYSKVMSDGKLIGWFINADDFTDMEFPKTSESLPRNDFAFFLDHFELMQYTGLKENAHEDASLNKEIYEGDIVEFINSERLYVEWNDDTCQWQYSDGSPINDGDRYATHKAIVGNIYENPELLTGKGGEIMEEN